MEDKTLIRMLQMYEDKLKEYMDKDAYNKFAEKVAKLAFFENISEHPDPVFREFCMKNWKRITVPEE